MDIIRHETKSTLAGTPEPNPLQTPEGVSLGTITAASIIVNWSAVTDADAYRVQQSTDAGVTWTDVSGDVNAPTVTKTVES